MKMKIGSGDLIWNYLGIIMTLGTSLFILPMILKFLNSEELGLWYIFGSVGTIATLFDFGFAPTLARNIAYCWSGATQLRKEGIVSEDMTNCISVPLMLKVIRTCKIIYFIIAAIVSVLLFSFGTIYIRYVSRDLGNSLHIIAWFIYSLGIIFNLYYGYYISFLRGVGAIREYNKTVVLSKSIQLVLSIVLLMNDFGILGLSIAYIVYGLIFRIIAKYRFYHYENLQELLKTNQVKIEIRDILETFQIIWHNAWRDGLVSLANFLTSQINTILCSLFLNLTQTGIYSVSLQLVTAISTFAGVFYSTYQPELQAAHLKGETKKCRKYLSISLVSYFLVYWLGIILFLLIGIRLLNIIKPNTIISIPILLLMSLNLYLTQRHCYYASYISNTNRIPYVRAFLITGICNVIISSLALINSSLGIWGLLLSQGMTQIAYNNWKWPLFVKRELNITIRDMFQFTIKGTVTLIQSKFYK